MSVQLFHFQKNLLELEISSFRDFLVNNLKEHEVPQADISLLEDYLEKLKSKLTQDIGKSIEEAVKTIVVKEWKTLFEADNYIDTGKTLEEQKYILENIINELNIDRKTSDKFIPADISHKVNTYLLDGEYKVFVLIEELTAELHLCNKEIDWIDALCERIRIMYYSGFLVGDMNGIDNLIKKLIRNVDYTSFVDLTGVTEFCSDGNVEETYVHPLELLLKKEDYKKIIEEVKKTGIVPDRPVNLLDFIKSVTLICIGVAPSDDYMDIDEDLENNKITGVTRAIDQNISVKAILSTTILYLKNNISFIKTTQRIELWYVELMSLMYHDVPKCLEFAKKASPYMFETIFQRK